MGVKTRLLTQNIFVLIGTIAVTACAGFLYFYISGVIYKAPFLNNTTDTLIVVTSGDAVIHKSDDFSDVQIKEMLMNLSMGENSFSYKNIKYAMKSESFISTGGVQYDVIKLTPRIDSTRYFYSLVIFVSTVFLLSFLAASAIARHQNTKDIINPIINLRKKTELITEGELDAEVSDEGCGEIRELGVAIEQLRLSLKNSIYYQQKIDDNRKFLISSISHDLKTPVTSIRGYIDGVLEGVADTDEKKQYYLKKAVEKTNNINTMIEDLLLYSKLDLNQIPFDIIKADIVSYIKEIAQEIIFDFNRESKAVLLESSVSQNSLVLLDRSKFKRAVLNISDNAKKNIPPETGTLTIKLRESNAYVIIEFNDNGKGISKKDLPYIFERFYRGDAARTTQGSSGLGLAITKQLISGMDGRIWATSTPDKGTSVMISLKKAVV